MPVPIRVGQTWRRRCEINGDEWNSIVVVGAHQITTEHIEYAVRAATGLDVVSTTAAALEENFTLVSSPDPEPVAELGADALAVWS